MDHESPPRLDELAHLRGRARVDLDAAGNEPLGELPQDLPVSAADLQYAAAGDVAIDQPRDLPPRAQPAEQRPGSPQRPLSRGTPAGGIAAKLDLRQAALAPGVVHAQLLVPERIFEIDES